MSDEIDIEQSKPPTVSLEAVERLSRDLRNAAKTMGVKEARYFVAAYYDLQDYRIAAANQQRKLLEGAQPSAFIEWLNKNLTTLEDQIRAMLDKWSGNQPMGIWARNCVGIGPVISAGLLANIDITKAPTVGHIWRFAGLDPTRKWQKGEKRPWNASLKRLCWIMGESFVKVSGNEKDIYGKIYLQRKEYEKQRNDSGQLADQAHERIARDKAAKRKLDPDLVKLLESGRLPQMALHERAKRYAVKLFLSHWFEEAYRTHYGAEPPKPYPIAHLGHAHRAGGPTS
jgi:hypothetical protein